MPVTFYCPKCKTPLRITRRKIGESVACPKCAASMTVPETDEPAPVEEAAVGAAAGAAPPPASAAKPPVPPASAEDDDEEYEDDEEDEELISEFIVYDDGSQTHLPKVDTDEPKSEAAPTATAPALAPPATPAPAPPADGTPPAKGGVKLPPPTTGSFQVPPGMILLPRRALLFLTCLFMGVTVGAYFVGYLFGQGDKTAGPTEPTGPGHNVIVEGRLTYITPTGNVAGDAGSILIALPQESSPGTKLPHIGLRPDEIAELGLGNEMASLIRKAGGNVVQSDRDGAFLFTVPKPGKYFLLGISRKADRSASRPVSPEDLAMMNRYFLNPESLIGKKKYLWKLESLEAAGSSQVHSFGEADQ